jgi:CRP/FNR family transcriptional regulator, anaerobic regulatory protein
MNQQRVHAHTHFEVIQCDLCPLRRVEGFRQFTHRELEFVRRFKAGEAKVPPGATILLEGAPSESLFTVLSGWGFRYKTLEDGRRQILNFVLPGDLLGLQSSLLRELHHSAEALTEMRLCIFRREGLGSLFREHPRLAFDLTWLAARQELVLDENLTSVGRRTARERMGALLLQLYRRAARIGLAEDHEIALPFTQQHLADALGLSLVHTNKTLKRLSQLGIARWSNGRLKILKPGALDSATAPDPRSEGPPRPFL